MGKDNEITKHKMILYTPQKNGVAKRMNRNILIKSAIYDVKFWRPKVIFGRSYMTTCHLINLTPSNALNGDIPHERWSGKLSNYSILKTFGCATFSHHSGEKLELRARKCFSRIPRKC